MSMPLSRHRCRSCPLIVSEMLLTLHVPSSSRFEERTSTSANGGVTSIIDASGVVVRMLTVAMVEEEALTSLSHSAACNAFAVLEVSAATDFCCRRVELSTPSRRMVMIKSTPGAGKIGSSTTSPHPP